MKNLKVEVLYFEGCPNHTATVELVLAVLRDEGLRPEVSEIEVSTEAVAEAWGFPGSPTIRVNGVDIEPAMRGPQRGQLACRVYAGGVPSIESVKAALREAEPTQCASPA